MGFIRRALPIVCALILVGCDGERKYADTTAVVTNVITQTKVVTVTNEVIKTITNFVEVSHPMELTRRKTAAYVVSTAAMRGSELRKFLQQAGARIIECNPGAHAVVEMPSKSVGELNRGRLVSVWPMPAADKIDVALAVKGMVEVEIRPLSSIDCEPLAKAVRAMGGELGQVITVGTPSVKVKISAEMLPELAKRSDVIAILPKRDK